MSEIMDQIITEYQIKNKELKKELNNIAEQLENMKQDFRKYNKEEATLLFKIQRVKQRLNSMKISKSGKNSFQNYSYYELEDINKPITDSLLEEGLASLFQFQDDTGCLQIIDSTTGAFIQWCTPILVSPRWQKTLETSSKKGDVGEVMKAKQALQTYARRTLYLQALEISEPNVIEQEGSKKSNKKQDNDVVIPEGTPEQIKQIFVQIKKEFGTKVAYNNTTIKNKLKSMKKNKKIDEGTYMDCLKIVD